VVSYGCGKMILVVDDDPLVLRLVGSFLESKGYRVLTAANGEEAVGILKQQPDCIALLLTDLTMPVLSGVELIRSIKAFKPALPIMAMSADFTLWPEEDFKGIRCLEKPFTIPELLGSVELSLSAGV
jgi:CheY-like chemotaxis protein